MAIEKIKIKLTFRSTNKTKVKNILENINTKKEEIKQDLKRERFFLENAMRRKDHIVKEQKN